MKPFSLIFLDSDKLLLTKKPYANWQSISDDYQDHLTSIGFESLEEIEEYIKIEYKLSSEQAKSEVDKLRNSDAETIEINL